MAGTWTYTESTNIVKVIGGTSGTPAQYSDFVTADRAGTGTELLAATAGLSPTLALDFAVRPVEDLALLVKCIVASKTAEADFIELTGTDWRGAAQTEDIDVTAGNGSYTSTKYWATITNLDCSDASSGGGGTQWADGTVQVTQDVWGVIWDFGGGLYEVDANFDIGDNSTSTHFTQVGGEAVNMTGFQISNSGAGATLNIGEVSNTTHSKNPVFLRLTGAGNRALTENNGITNLYSASIYDVGTFNSLKFCVGNSSTVTIVNSLHGTIGTFNDLTLAAGGTAIVRDWYTYQTQVMNLNGTLTLSGIRMEAPKNGLADAFVDAEVTGPNITNSVTRDASMGSANTFTLTDPLFTPTQSKLLISNASGEIHENYTCNIHVVDRAGVDLESVTVACEDQAASSVFSISTDSGGDIAEQNIIAKKWVGTSETETDNNNHKFTLSKAGYKTLVLDAITVNTPIVWHLEMQAQTPPLDAARF